ncbi:HAD family hydrolase [Alteribacillus sp. HJP-4]|uniref:HAD family hydrolase n=1 Tax=Alteribacillus sp. HJP-4 TaxID=2775394 RepID=UPI0035CCDA10
MLKTIIFDLDDTLLWDKKSVKEALRATCLEAELKTGISHQSLEQTVRKVAPSLYETFDTFEFTKKIGINPFEGLWGTFSDKTDLQFRKMYVTMPEYQKLTWTTALQQYNVEDKAFGSYLAERFIFHRERLPYIYEDTFEVLADLNTEYTLIMLTNGSPTLQNKKLEMTPQLVPYFDYIVVSGAFGVGKPDPSIFEHVLKLTDSNKDEAIMVGDNLNTDISGSNAAGISNIWINRDSSDNLENVPFTHEVKSLKAAGQIIVSL